MKTGKLFNVAKLLKGIELEGFVRDEGRGLVQSHDDISTHPWNGCPLPYFVRFTSPAVVLILDFNCKVDSGEYIFASGHTYFQHKGDWFTNDRRGINDSFYLGKVDVSTRKDRLPVPADVLAVLMGQAAKALEDIAALKAAAPKENVPGTAWSVTAARKAEITERLKAGKCYEFRPAGMGQGLLIQTRRTLLWQTERLAIAKFFGVEKIFASETDCD